MKRKIFCFLCCALLLVGCGSAQSNEGVKDQGQAIEFSSEITSDECALCGSREEFLLSMYRGQTNIGIIDLNTFDMCNLDINRYDDYGNLIEEKSSYSTMTTNNFGEDGMRVSYHTNADRGYASANIYFSEENKLEIEKIKKLLCNECFDKIYEKAWTDCPYSIGVIDFQTQEVRLFESNITGFSFNDYYLDIDFSPTDKEQERVEADVLVFYCPVRY